MLRSYRSPREHLDDVLGLITQVFERQILAHQELGFLSRFAPDEHTGTFVGQGEAKASLWGRELSPDGARRVGELDTAIAARADKMERQLEASRAAGTAMPLDTIRRAFGLSPTETRTLMALIAIESSARHRQLMRYLANEASRVHPDPGVLSTLVYDGPATRDHLVRDLALDAPLFRYRLVEPIGARRQVEETPFLLRPLRVNTRVLELVHGYARLDREVATVGELVEHPPGFDRLLLDDARKAEAVELLRGGAGHHAPVLCVAGPEGSGRRSLIYGAAHAIGARVLRIRCEALPRDGADIGRLAQAIAREAVLWHAVLLLDGVDQLAADPESGRPDRAGAIEAAILADYTGPVAATSPRTDARPVRFDRGLVFIDLTVPSEASRIVLWDRALGAAAPAGTAERAAGRYPLTGGIIERAAASALARSHARGDQVTADDIHTGVRSTLDVKLSTLGVRIAWRQTWADLVLPEDSLDEVKEFIARVRHRRRVYDEWGFARKVAKGLGLSALFKGPPGTGKTMVAGIIAEELALDLYQIDLSRIVSKYVGETEKNLASLFDAAEAGHAILLFDEADSLFAKRTEVKSSVDRYANLEVNYLLQRMEAFNGITILTTNLDASIDEAFRRRISFRVDFPMPDAEERVRLWQTMLPTEAAVEPGVDYERLAQRYEMSGGYIRNAVLRAAFLAAEDGGAIGMSHLLRAANLEYVAMGKVMSQSGIR
jgi:ATP-dependent 26S proteasome regulatory subunit